MGTTLIQITDVEFKDLIAEAYTKGAEMAKRHFESENDQDIIPEEKALEILKCSYSKLAKLRSARKIVFYTNSRPYSYSKKSIKKYMESTAT